MKIKFDSPSSVHISSETTEEELLIHWLSIYRPVIKPYWDLAGSEYAGYHGSRELAEKKASRPACGITLFFGEDT